MIKKMSRKANSKKFDVISYLRKRTIELHITSSRLEKYFDLSGAEVRSIVHYARAILHLPICSDSAGYFYGETREQMRSRIRFINEAVCGLEKAEFEKDKEIQEGFGFEVRTKYDRYPD